MVISWSRAMLSIGKGNPTDMPRLISVQSWRERGELWEIHLVLLDEV
jgi:hypothetical protein